MRQSKGSLTGSVILMFVVALAFAGCGGGSEGGGLNETQSSALSSSITSLASAAQASVSAEFSVPDSKENQWVSGTKESFTISGTVSNPNGTGSAEVKGTGSASGEGFQMETTITLTDWTKDDMTVSGSLTSTLTVTTMTPVSSSMTLSGSLKVDTGGRFPLTVKVDIQVKTEGSEATVCGKIGTISVGTGACS